LTQDDCIFCNMPASAIVAENDLAYAIRDNAPVTALHTLIIPKRHVASVFEASAAEREAMHQLALQCRESICEHDPTVEGFNYGSNIGQAAGQKIFHAHVHLIPRREGEGELATAGHRAK
jgi:diadenosine tetraphosphate (Ap4A) HIT family hydrolase